MKRYFALFSVLLCFAVLAACSPSKIIGGYEYDDFGNYTIGGGSFDFSAFKTDTLDIDWVNGSVTVTVNDNNTISFDETADGTIEENLRLRYYLENKTLHIRFSKPGKLNMGNTVKHLTVSVPKYISLAALKINTISSDVSLDGVTALSCGIETVSGKVNAGATVNGDIDLKTVSGEVSGTFSGSVDEIKGNSVSGSMELKTDSARSFKLESVSGNIGLASAKLPEGGSMKSASGSTSLNLPEQGRYRVTVDTTSGKFSSSMALAIEGNVYTNCKSRDEYGEIPFMDYAISTVSGNVYIGKAES